jgi:CHAT domain-containing protein
VTLLSGAEASEERFLALAPGRAALHLATHGFFLSGDCPPQDGASPAGRTRGIGIAPEREGGEEDGAAAENPLLRSGLALAGANARARAAGGSRDDGILTAEEIGALGLERTDWAVLSACDTGSGRIQSGEGVLGLRRAFQAAGVKTLILSLWPVDDEATRSWMAALYEACFGDGATAADAHRRACVQAIESCRARGLSTHPYFWAAFIAAGDWR